MTCLVSYLEVMPLPLVNKAAEEGDILALVMPTDTPFFLLKFSDFLSRPVGRQMVFLMTTSSDCFSTLYVNIDRYLSVMSGPWTSWVLVTNS